MSNAAAAAVTAAALVAATAFGLYAELPYYLGGETAEGTVTAVKEVTRRTGRGTARRRKTEYEVRYAFREAAGAEREGTVTRSASLPVGSAVEVEYLPGRPDRSRLGGSHRGDLISLLTVPGATAAALAAWWAGRAWNARARRRADAASAD